MDDSGTIELDEFKGSLPSTFKRGKNYLETSRESAYRKAKANLADRPRQGEQAPYFKDTPVEKEQQRVDDTWREIIASVDTDGDGRINFEEF